MRGRVLVLVLGLAVGAGLFFRFYVEELSPTVSSPVPAPPSPAASPEPQYRRQLASVQGQLEQLDAENAMLRHQLGELKSSATTVTVTVAATAPPPPASTPSPLAALFGNGWAPTQPGETMGRMLRTALQQQIETKVTTLKQRLRLTDDQEQRMRQLLEARFGLVGEASSLSVPGRMSRQELELLRTAQANPDAAIKKFLSADQQTEYDKYQVEERQSQAQMAANVELMQLQQILQLDPSQQERAYAALYGVTLKQITPPAEGAHEPSDYSQIVVAKETALQPILTPRQFQGYQKFLDSQQEMVSALMDSFTNDVTPVQGIASGPFQP